MSGPHVTYLSSDSLTEGVGWSQVLSYVERLPARGVRVTLHSFEKEPATDALLERIAASRIDWVSHPFGRLGAVGGVGRIARGASAIRGASLVHARADLAAASALIARSAPWVWDCRGLFADQRLALGTLRAGSPEHRALRAVERGAARRSSAIITLTDAIVPELERRHGPGIERKTTVITTCVDTARFAVADPPPASPVRLLLAGTINRYYDVPAMIRLARAVRARRPSELVLATPGSTAWDRQLGEVATERVSVAPHEMPALVASSHAGLSVCRDDAGVSLLGSMPTKLGEFLATGRPVVVNRLLGDAAVLVERHDCGVIVSDGSDAGIAAAADRLLALVDDPETAARCRALAEEHFDLDRAVDRLAGVYELLA